MEKFWKMCLNWKVISGVAVVGLGILLFAPHQAAAALPLLVLAICPLSMLLMMRSMQGDRTNSQTKRPGRSSPPPGQPPLADLKAELARLQEQQDDLKQQIAGLGGSGGSVPNDDISR